MKVTHVPTKKPSRTTSSTRNGGRPGATGEHYGAVPPPNDCLCPPNENCASPSEDCAPKKLTGLGLLECKSRP